jgi:hypothetical protein
MLRDISVRDLEGLPSRLPGICQTGIDPLSSPHCIIVGVNRRLQGKTNHCEGCSITLDRIKHPPSTASGVNIRNNFRLEIHWFGKQLCVPTCYDNKSQ